MAAAAPAVGPLAGAGRAWIAADAATPRAHALAPALEGLVGAAVVVVEGAGHWHGLGGSDGGAVAPGARQARVVVVAGVGRLVLALREL